MPGSFSGNSTSTTGPTTWTILPLFIVKPDFFPFTFSAELAARNLQEFFRDIALAQFVVFEGQISDQLGSIIRGARHSNHASTLFARFRLQQNPEEVDVQ